MLNLSAEIRKEGDDIKSLRAEGKLPAVLYGPKIKNISLELNYRDFEKIFKETGESSLISLEVKGEKKPFQILVHEIQEDPLTNEFIHVDLYQPDLKKEIEADIPLVFEGESEAVKSLGGTLIKNITELEVKALPQNLPHEIKVNIEKLKTFEDHIKVSDLEIPEGVKVLKDPKEIIASVVPPTKVEEELEKPIEEKVEEAEKVEGKEDKEEKKEEPVSEEKEEKEEK